MRSCDALVLGATGFIGRALVTQLSAQGQHIVCVVRPGPRNLDALRRLPNVEVIAAELAETLPELSPRQVFNLAAAGVARGQAVPDTLAAGNAGIVADLFRHASSWPVQRIVHVGSCAEFGMVDAQRVTETFAIVPVSPYGQAKADASALALQLGTSLGLPVAVLRLFGTLGPGEAPQRLLPYVIHQLRKGLPCALTSGMQVRDFTLVDDIARALLAAMAAPLPPVCALNVGSGQGTTVRALVDQVADHLAAPRALLQFGARPQPTDEPLVLVADPTAFQAATGWRAGVDLNTAIARTIAWHSEHAP